MGYHQSERAKDGSFSHVRSLGLLLSVFGEAFRRWGDMDILYSGFDCSSLLLDWRARTRHHGMHNSDNTEL